MPEIPFCTRCDLPIDVDDEEYVVINKDQEYKPEKWVYAHSNCQRKWQEEIDAALN